MRWISGVLALLALGFTYYGLSLMYDNSYSQRIVGGDAYNFIIYAARGTAYVCAGVVFATLSVATALLADRVNVAFKSDAEQSTKSG